MPGFEEYESYPLNVRFSAKEGSNYRYLCSELERASRSLFTDNSSDCRAEAIILSSECQIQQPEESASIRNENRTEQTNHVLSSISALDEMKEILMVG